MKMTAQRSRLLEDILRLRYGVTNPNKQNKAKFSYPAVASYLNKPLYIVNQMAQKYFKDIGKV